MTSSTFNNLLMKYSTFNNLLMKYSIFNNLLMKSSTFNNLLMKYSTFQHSYTKIALIKSFACLKFKSSTKENKNKFTSPVAERQLASILKTNNIASSETFSLQRNKPISKMQDICKSLPADKMSLCQ